MFTGGQWIATPQEARDDKSGSFTMKGVKRLEFSLCHCEEDSMDEAAIHRVSGDVDGVVCSGSQGQWIATGLRPRDDKGD